MKRTLILSVVAILAAIVVVRAQRPRFRLVEATIPQMRDAMAKGQLTSRELVAQYLARIGLYEDRLHAAIVVNPPCLSSHFMTRPSAYTAKAGGVL